MVEYNEALPDPNSLLGTKSVPSLSFKDVEVGTRFEGVITDLRTVQVRNYDDPNKLEYWDDGKPKLQIEVTIATSYNDPTLDEDDGTRRVYLFGQKLQAAKAEMKAKGIDKLEKGFKFAIEFTGTKPSSNKRYNDVKLYAIEVTPSKSNPDVDALLADQGAKPVASSSKATGAKLSSAQVEKAQKLASAGFNAGEIAETMGVSEDSIASVLDTF
jgi:hypothetical protein